MSTSHAFKAGWQDKLLAVPTPPKYERCRTGLAVAYERGRHCAALWEYTVSLAGRELEKAMQMKKGTISNAGPSSPPPTFAKAYRTMPKELRALIRAEKKFCALKPKKWSI